LGSSTLKFSFFHALNTLNIFSAVLIILFWVPLFRENSCSQPWNCIMGHVLSRFTPLPTCHPASLPYRRIVLVRSSPRRVFMGHSPPDVSSWFTPLPRCRPGSLPSRRVVLVHSSPRRVFLVHSPPDVSSWFNPLPTYRPGLLLSPTCLPGSFPY
jgi:hypothetical protein